MGSHSLLSSSFSVPQTSPSSSLRRKPAYPTTHICLPPPARCGSRRLQALNTNNSSSSSGEEKETPSQVPPAPAPASRSVEIRFRRGSRKRSTQQQASTDNILRSNPSPPKDWDSMTLSEKMAQLYVGEKGLLFWLNKFAYASIFIIIGGWILFRFVGPSIGLYQLDSTPLAPSALFKGS
ncbi:hypothetical protein ACLOJK_027934 [Asimina triloba]